MYAFAEGRRTLERNGFRLEPVQLVALSSGDTSIDMTPLPLFRLEEATLCRDLGNTGWQQITDIAREGRVIVRIDDYRPFDSRLILYIGRRSSSIAEPLLAMSQGPRSPAMNVTTFPVPTGPELAAALGRDGVTASGILTQQRPSSASSSRSTMEGSSPGLRSAWARVLSRRWRARRLISIIHAAQPSAVGRAGISLSPVRRNTCRSAPKG